MQAIRTVLGKIEARSRAVAIGVTAIIVLGAVGWPHAVDLARFYMDQAGTSQPLLVMKLGYEVVLDGHATPVVGSDECPRVDDPQKAFWLGGRPDDIPPMGCVVVGPATREVHVRLNSGVREAWKVVRQERSGFPATLLQRPNGDYIAQAK